MQTTIWASLQYTWQCTWSTVYDKVNYSTSCSFPIQRFRFFQILLHVTSSSLHIIVGYPRLLSWVTSKPKGVHLRIEVMIIERKHMHRNESIESELHKIWYMLSLDLCNVALLAIKSLGTYSTNLDRKDEGTRNVIKFIHLKYCLPNGNHFVPASVS